MKAFPSSGKVIDGGMELHDWYVGMAIQGILASGRQPTPNELLAEARAIATVATQGVTAETKEKKK